LQIIRNIVSKYTSDLLSSHLDTAIDIAIDIAIYSCFCRMHLDGKRCFRYRLPGTSLCILENYISNVFDQMLGARCAVHAHIFLFWNSVFNVVPRMLTLWHLSFTFKF
jgi:hypothetical protein